MTNTLVTTKDSFKLKQGTGTNKTSSRGSNNPNYGKKFTKELCDKLSVAHMGNRHTEATKAKMSATRKGRVITWGDKISAAKTGKPSNRKYWPPVTWHDKISEGHLGHRRYHRDDIVAVIKDNPSIKVMELAKYLGTGCGHIVANWGGINKLRKEAGL